MRPLKLFFFLLCFGWILPLQAQDNASEIALQRIEAARVSGATELSLSWLGLRELPAELWQLTHLEILYLSNNQLIELPPEIGLLTNLQVLHLYNNQLTRLPAEIGQLSNLQSLYLWNNQLTSLPTEIGQLTTLCYLGLSYNNLRHLPNTISDLPRLTELEQCGGAPSGLYLNGNPLITPPQEVIDEGTEAVSAYLRNQTWWHLQGMMLSAASGIGFLALIFLGLRLRYRGQRKPKQKRGEL
jgi:Leucine Rich Repeat (LRR) protein